MAKVNRCRGKSVFASMMLAAKVLSGKKSHQDPIDAVEQIEAARAKRARRAVKAAQQEINP